MGLRLGLLACLISLLPAAFAATASATALPPQGIFEYCTLDTEMQTCLHRLEMIHQGGVQVVVSSAADASLTSLAAYAAAAHSLGMSVMWQLNAVDWWEGPPTATAGEGAFSAFASACGCDENAPLLAYTISWLSQLPGTYGYWAADVFDNSLGSGEQAAVAAYVAQIKQQDPAHPVMIGSADEAESEQYQGVADVMATEIYPVTNASLLPVSDNLSMWNAIGGEVAAVQQSADDAGRQSAFILQAFSWGDSVQDGEAVGICSQSDTPSSCWARAQYPSEAEQLELRNEVLRDAHPKLILWYSLPGTYGSVTSDPSSTFPAGAQAEQNWSGLSAAIRAPYPGARSANGRRAQLVRGGAIRAHADSVTRTAHRRKHDRKHRRKHRRRKRHKQRHARAA